MNEILALGNIGELFSTIALYLVGLITVLGLITVVINPVWKNN